MSEHRYRVTSIPTGCTQFYVGQFVFMPVSDDPAPPLQIEVPTGSCAGAIMVLDDEEE